MGRLPKSPVRTVYSTSLLMQLLSYNTTGLHRKYLQGHGT